MMRRVREPEITINGQRLTEAQAMTARVALQIFAMGVEDLEPTLRDGYRAAIRQINEIIGQTPA